MHLDIFYVAVHASTRYNGIGTARRKFIFRIIYYIRAIKVRQQGKQAAPVRRQIQYLHRIDS